MNNTVTQEQFNLILEQRLEKIRGVLGSKAKEYATTTDRMHNFNVAARIMDTTPEKALWGIFMKHLVSVIDLVDGVDATVNMVDEKMGDMINYMILLEAMLKNGRGTEGT